MYVSNVLISLVLALEVPATRLFRTLERPRIHMLGFDVPHQCPFGRKWVTSFTSAPLAFQIVMGVTKAVRISSARH